MIRDPLRRIDYADMTQEQLLATNLHHADREQALRNPAWPKFAAAVDGRNYGCDTIAMAWEWFALGWAWAHAHHE